MNILNIFVSIHGIGESYELSEHIIFFSEKYHKLGMGSNRISGYTNVNIQDIFLIKSKWCSYIESNYYTSAASKIYRNNLYNYSILCFENYKIDTFFNMVHNSLLSKSFSR